MKKLAFALALSILVAGCINVSESEKRNNATDMAKEAARYCGEGNIASVTSSSFTCKK